MIVSNHAPMLGLRAGYGERFASERRVAKLVEREAIAADIAAELDTAEVIAAHAITPARYSTITDEDMSHVYAYDDLPEIDAATDRWFDWWDDEDRDPFPFGDPDDCPHTFAEAIARGDIDAEAEGFVDITTLADHEIPGGWGTGIAWEDLGALTITNRPYLWSTGKEAAS